MAGEKYAARRVYWADMVHQCNQSGMIKIDWLRQHDISSKSLDNQKSLLFLCGMMTCRDEFFQLNHEQTTANFPT